MAVASPERHTAPTRSPRRTFIAALLTLLALLIALVVVVFLLSGVTLARDDSALASVDVKPLGGTIEHLEALGPHGGRIPIAVQDGRLTPLRKLAPGTQLTVLVTVQRPGWIGWALGKRHTVHLTLTTPVATVNQQWMTVHSGSDVRVAFREPVSEIIYRGPRGVSAPHPPARRALGLPGKPAAHRNRPGCGGDAPVGVGGQAHRSQLVPALSLPGDGHLSVSVEHDHTGGGDLPDVLQAGFRSPRRPPSEAGPLHPRELERTGLAHAGVQAGGLRGSDGRPADDDDPPPGERHLRLRLGAGRHQPGAVDGPVRVDTAPAAALGRAGISAGRVAPLRAPGGPDRAGAGAGGRGTAAGKLRLALPEHPPSAEGAVGARSGEHDRPGRRDEVRERQRHDGRRGRRSGRVASR